MKVIITGATGMIGGLILKKCLEDETITEVVSLVRKASDIHHFKLTEVMVDNFLNYDDHAHLLKNTDFVYYCQGVYTGAVSPELFRKITVDYPLALAETLQSQAAQINFCLLSGQGADRTEKSRMMFARDKGAVENKLAAMNWKGFYSCRPAYIYPVQKRKEPNVGYVISRWFYPLLKLMGQQVSITSTQLASAMFHVGKNGHVLSILENKDLLQLNN